MTESQERRIERIWNDRPEPLTMLTHQAWMNELINPDGTLGYAGHTWHWDYRLSLWVLPGVDAEEIDYMRHDETPELTAEEWSEKLDHLEPDDMEIPF